MARPESTQMVTVRKPDGTHASVVRSAWKNVYEGREGWAFVEEGDNAAKLNAESSGVGSEKKASTPAAKRDAAKE